MSDNKIFSRSKSSELIQELDQIDKKSKNSLQRKKNVVKKVISNITIGNNDMINMFKEILKIYELSGSDLELKKLINLYFVTYSSLKPDYGSKLLSLLYKDLLDANVTVSSLLLKTISSINLNLPQSIPHIVKILENSKADSLMKKTACFSVARIYEFDSKLAGENNLLGILNDQLYDPNIVVVTTLLLALNDITERNPTLQLRINKDHAVNLLDSVQKCNDWSVVYILNSLMSFVPQTNEEAFLIIDKVLPILQHENSSVVLNAVKVIAYNCNYALNPEDVIPTLSKRLGNALISLLSKPSEIQFLVLRNIILLLLSKPNLIEFDVKMFFCKYDDPIYVKDTKLEIIYLMADDENINVVLNELEEYATDIDIQMSRKLIRAIGNLAVKLDSCCSKCVVLLGELITNGVPYIVQEGAIVLKNILRKYKSVNFNSSILNLIDHIELIDEPESKNCMIWILGNYCEIIPNLEVLLEEFGMNFKEEPIDVQLCFLTSIVKYYLKFPKQGSDLLVKFLKLVTEEMNNPDLRERGYFYWRLVSSNDINLASSVVNAPQPVISSENEKLDQSILEELELNIGTLASIYLKPVNQVFRLSKQKALPKSDALQPRSTTAEKRKSKKPIKHEVALSPTTPNTDRFENMDLDKRYSIEPLRAGFEDLTPPSKYNNKRLSRKLSMSFKKIIN